MKPCVAVIDIGSSSIKLLVAQKGDLPAARPLDILNEVTLPVRISAGIAKESMLLTSDAISRGVDAVATLKEAASKHGPSVIATYGTSALRDAKNAHVFAQRLKDELALDLTIITGVEEARLVGKGARCEVKDQTKFIQIDMGGGSTELISVNDSKVLSAVSLQLGAVRLAEQFRAAESGIFSETLRAQIRAHVGKLVAQNASPLKQNAHSLVVLTGGTGSVARRLLSSEDGALDRKMLARLEEKLCCSTLNERLRWPGLPKERADILPPALVALNELLGLIDPISIRHVYYGLRHGAALDLLEAIEPAPK